MKKEHHNAHSCHSMIVRMANKQEVDEKIPKLYQVCGKYYNSVSRWDDQCQKKLELNNFSWQFWFVLLLLFKQDLFKELDPDGDELVYMRELVAFLREKYTSIDENIKVFTSSFCHPNTYVQVREFLNLCHTNGDAVLW